jgi:hypothetical protein
LSSDAASPPVLHICRWVARHESNTVADCATRNSFPDSFRPHRCVNPFASTAPALHLHPIDEYLIHAGRVSLFFSIDDNIPGLDVA